MDKHIYFEKSKKWRCYVFLNQKPKYMLSQLETVCQPNQHKLK
jgi:hypothetical protein